MNFGWCGLCLSRWQTRSRFGCARAIRRRDIIAEQINRGLLTVYRGLTGSGGSLRSGTFNFCFLLYNRKRLASQWLLLTRWFIMQSLTTSSSPSSRVEGSGIPPSITHRLLSYFVRMKFSIFLFTKIVRKHHHTTSTIRMPLRIGGNVAGCQLCFPVSASY